MKTAMVTPPVVDTAAEIPCTKPDTRLMKVMNSLQGARGMVSFRITRRKKEGCTPHEIGTHALFTEETAFRGPTNAWLLKIGDIICTPQAGPLFDTWVNTSAEKVERGEQVDWPLFEFTRFN